MKDIIQETRESMVEKGKMPPSAHDFALKDMEFSNSNRFFMVSLPRQFQKKRERKGRENCSLTRAFHFRNMHNLYIKVIHPGTEKVDYLFYPGCQLSASYPEYVEKTYNICFPK